MSKKMRVSIKRILFLLKIIGSTIGFITLMVKFALFRNIVFIFLISLCVSILLEYAEYKSKNEGEQDEADSF